MKKITQLAIIPILVADQDEALRFFTEKLELEKRADMIYGPGLRWLTVAPKGQKKARNCPGKARSVASWNTEQWRERGACWTPQPIHYLRIRHR